MGSPLSTADIDRRGRLLTDELIRRLVAVAHQVVPVLQTLTDGSSHRLWHDHIKTQKRWLIFAVLCMVLFSAITSGQAFLVKPALDEVFINRDRSMLWLVPVVVIIYAFADPS